MGVKGYFCHDCCHCLQQKRPNQNTLFARAFEGPGLVGQEEGFWSVKDTISRSECQPYS